MNITSQKKRVLFVCRQNRVRSTTAELVFGTRPDLEVRSAGVADYAAVPLTQEMFDWADQVFVFSKCQLQLIQERFQSSIDHKPVVCLNVPDRFEYKSPKLVKTLTGRLEPYLGKPEAPYRNSDLKVARSYWSASLQFLQQRFLPLRQIATWSLLCMIWSWCLHALLGAQQILL
jgi:predicted protein tyrosine phosphatase